MKRPKVIWLCSWYPNKEDKFRGDFIERHAKAVHPFADIEVLHFVPYGASDALETDQKNGFPVHIHYSSIQNKLLSYMDMYRWFVVFLKDYIAEKGQPDILHVHIPWKAGLVARRLKKMYSLPLIITEHHGIYNRIIENNYFTKSAFYKTMIKKVFKAANLVLPVSQSLGEEISEVVTPVKFEPVPNVVDIEKFHFQNITNGQKFRFLHISNASENKNVRGIINAFAEAYNENENLELILAGFDPTKWKLCIKDKGLPEDAIQCKGVLEYIEVAEQFRQAHCFIIFSDWESQSCVVLEALCSGRPVICSKVGGAKELVDLQNGILIPPRDEEALKSAILETFIHFDEYHLEQISKEAQLKYSYANVGKQILAHYQNILAEV